MANELTRDQAKARDEACAKYRIDIQTVLIQRDQWQTCMNCDSYTKAKGEHVAELGERVSFWCREHRAYPPPDVVVNGCPQHQMDIPF